MWQYTTDKHKTLLQKNEIHVVIQLAKTERKKEIHRLWTTQSQKPLKNKNDNEKISAQAEFGEVRLPAAPIHDEIPLN